jgi:hypothetical protein
LAGSGAMNQIGQLIAPNFCGFNEVLLNPYILLGFVLYGLGTIFWLIALSKRISALCIRSYL